MRKEGFENLTLTGHTDNKIESGKQIEQELGGIAKGQTLLRLTKYKKLWRTMIVHILR